MCVNYGVIQLSIVFMVTLDATRMRRSPTGYSKTDCFSVSENVCTSFDSSHIGKTEIFLQPFGSNIVAPAALELLFKVRMRTICPLPPWLPIGGKARFLVEFSKFKLGEIL
jgi:hypothetical protein